MPLSEPVNYLQRLANCTSSYQSIDGFGVNINSRYWDSENAAYMRAMDLLVHDLGATLYRVDIWGKSNWVDPESKLNASVLNEKTYRRIYEGEVFQKGWAMMRFLNEHGIQPYLTVSGDVPRWMLGEDGKTLVEYEQLADMLASMVAWARHKERLDFRLFGPMNETDHGSPEGPSVSAEGYVKLVRVLDRKLRERGIHDIRYVVAEQAWYNTEYVQAFVESPDLHERIGAFGVHSYFDFPAAKFAEVPKLVDSSPCAGTSVWLSEYGDLDQTGEKEWYIAWVSTSRLLNALEGGLNGAMVWDAYDNYHDHNEHWTIYGLIRTGLNAYTPKKRYYAAKHVYRYVLPGFQRIALEPYVHPSFWPDREPAQDTLRMLAFADAAREHVTLVGMNRSLDDVYMNLELNGFGEHLRSQSVTYYRTTANENCIKVAEVPTRTRNHPHWGIDVRIPARSIFTITNVA